MFSFLSWVCSALYASVLSSSTLDIGSASHTFRRSLSQSSEIYFPGSEGFENATLRWSAAQTPSFDAIVKVTTEQDVVETVSRLLQL